MKTNAFRVLSLDIGTKRIGVAKWAPKLVSVQPLTLIHVQRPIEAFKTIASLAEEFDATHLVLGYPLMPNGNPGQMAKIVLKWRDKLEAELNYSIELWDERMTSKQAERDLSALGIRSKRIRETVDMAAAMRILEGWLNAQDWYT